MTSRAWPLFALASALVVAGCSGSGAKVASQTPSPTVSATPSPTASPAARHTSPLTGLPAGANAGRPALAIKIDNVAGAFPQRGLNQADLVVDELVEGGLTRLFAVFQSQDATQVGPIRSGRPVDADLLPLLGHPLFAFSGASPGELAPIVAHGGATRIVWDYTPQYFFVLRSYPSPHRVFASTATLYREGRHRAPTLTAPPALFTYSATSLAGPVARTIIVPMSGVSTATWTWSGRAYLRAQNGRTDRLADGSVVSANDVVVMSVGTRPTGMRDAAGNPEPLDVVIGSGPCWVFRDGHAIRGTWQRRSLGSRMQLLDASGRVIPLRAGRTWLELLPRPGVPRIR